MRFKVDENLPRETCDLLNRAGHDAISVGEQALSGADDARIYQLCQVEQRAAWSTHKRTSSWRRPETPSYAAGRHSRNNRWRGTTDGEEQPLARSNRWPLGAISAGGLARVRNQRA